VGHICRYSPATPSLIPFFFAKDSPLRFASASRFASADSRIAATAEPSDHRPLAGRPPLPNAHGPQPSHRTGAASQRCRPLAWLALVTGMESMSDAPKVPPRRTQWRLISAIWPAELHVRPNQDHISLGGDHKSRGAGVWLPALASTMVDFRRSSDPFRQSHPQ
jgi:hypothetical protein